MGKRVAMGCLGALVGYALGGFGGGYLISALSSNTHDRSVEAAMTGAFVLGPIVAVLGAMIGVWRSGSAARVGDQNAGRD